jgi:hypothetical protein
VPGAHPSYLDPHVSMLWREPGTLQVGLDPRRAAALHGVSPGLPDLLRGLSGAASSEVAEAESRLVGLADELDQARRLLSAAGLLDSTDPRLALSAAWVEVVGAGVLAEQVAQGLLAAGVGRCGVVAEATATRPDLVVVCPDNGRGLDHADALLGAGTAHLWAHLRDGRAVVGPLVAPGRSSCLRCHDLHRCDTDPAWPILALAWEQARAPQPAQATVHLLAGLAARQALTWLSGARPAVVDATLEEQPDGEVLRRRWAVHPACGCGWAPDATGTVE